MSHGVTSCHTFGRAYFSFCIRKWPAQTVCIMSKCTVYHDGGSGRAPIALWNSTVKIFARLPPFLQLTLTDIVFASTFTTSANSAGR